MKRITVYDRDASADAGTAVEHDVGRTRAIEGRDMEPLKLQAATLLPTTDGYQIKNTVAPAPWAPFAEQNLGVHIEAEWTKGTDRRHGLNDSRFGKISQLLRHRFKTSDRCRHTLPLAVRIVKHWPTKVFQMGQFTALRRQSTDCAAGSLITTSPLSSAMHLSNMGLLKLEAVAPPQSVNRPRIEKSGLASVQGQPSEIGIGATDRPCITQLAARHEADFRGLLLNLDKASRAIRFDGTVTDDSLLRHSRCAFSGAAWIAGVFADEGLRGVVEVYDIGQSRTVEAAFLVEQTWRRRGLGSALLKAAMQWAAEADRIMLRMVFSRHNWPMRKLASNAQARLDLGFDEITADIAIGASGIRQ